MGRRRHPRGRVLNGVAHAAGMRPSLTATSARYPIPPSLQTADNSQLRAGYVSLRCEVVCGVGVMPSMPTALYVVAA